MTVYAENPAEQAQVFEAAGARMLHVVDLDGALESGAANIKAVKAIRQAVRIPIQLGGGLRDLTAVDAALDAGIDSVIIGTLAVQNMSAVETALKKHGPQRIQLGVDTRKGFLALRGWKEQTTMQADTFAQHWHKAGMERAVFTDIARDGMLQGMNLQAIESFARASGLKVTASGGVKSIQDIQFLKTLEPYGVDRVIVGKAIYEGRFLLSEFKHIDPPPASRGA